MSQAQERVQVQMKSAAPASRRELSFPDIHSLLAEIDRIIAADRAGTLRCLGNWTAGQTFGHLAGWINFNYEGYPFKLPWGVRWLLAWQLRRTFQRGFSPGTRLPGVSGGTYCTERLSTEEGAQRLRAALGRLQRREPFRHPHPALGPWSVDECTQATLRHAELHLSYLRSPESR